MGDKKLNLVVFCGAGFSAKAGIPIMAEFADKLRDSNYLTADEQRDFDIIQRECNNLGVLVGSSSRNLEQLSSFLSILSLTQPHYKFPGCKLFDSPENALRLVTKSIYHLVRVNLTADDLEYLKPFFVDTAGAHCTSFITTNYDLLIELASHKFGMPVRPSENVLALSSMNGKPSIYAKDPGAPRLFKLHGSANWFTLRNGTLKILDEPRVSGDPSAPYLDMVHFNLPGDLSVIIRPSVIKANDFPSLQEQWQGAAAAISDADILVFVGYSFPETDSFMRYFLGAALAGNVKIRRILSLNPDEAAIGRFKDLFQAQHLKDTLIAINGKFEGGGIWLRI